jgi:hypothetical protein
MIAKTVARSLAERERRGEKPPSIRAWWVLVNEPDAPAALRGAARAMRLLWHLGRAKHASAQPYLTIGEAVAVWQRAVAVGLVVRKSADIERLALDYGLTLHLVGPAETERSATLEQLANVSIPRYMRGLDACFAFAKYDGPEETWPESPECHCDTNADEVNALLKKVSHAEG